MVLRRYRHTSPLAFAVRCPAVLFSSKPICPRHPGLLLGSHQTAGGVPAPRESNPRQDRCRLPSLPVTVLSRSDCDWTGVSLSPLSVMAAPGAVRRLRRSVVAPCGGMGKPKTSISDFSPPPPTADRRAAAKLAYAHRNDNRNVSDEWIFSYQATRPFTVLGCWARSNFAPHLTARGKHHFSPHRENFFNFSFSRSIRR